MFPTLAESVYLPDGPSHSGKHKDSRGRPAVSCFLQADPAKKKIPLLFLSRTARPPDGQCREWLSLIRVRTKGRDAVTHPKRFPCRLGAPFLPSPTVHKHTQTYMGQ